MRYIIYNDGVWKVKKKSFEQLLRDIQHREFFDLDHYGKQITGKVENLHTIISELHEREDA